MPLLSIARDGSEKRYGEAVGEGEYEVLVVRLNSKGRYVLDRRSLVDTEFCRSWFERIGPVYLVDYMTLGEVCGEPPKVRTRRTKPDKDKGKPVKRSRSSITF